MEWKQQNIVKQLLTFNMWYEGERTLSEEATLSKLLYILPKSGLLLKERICSPREQILSF